ncbi:hypothetical protein A2U01_0078389, partial [Trifolium medium]|nr:hypothetical protein [Trifolium medium]
EQDDSNSEAQDSYGGGTLLVQWITVGKVSAKHVSTSTLKSVYDQGGAKMKSD